MGFAILVRWRLHFELTLWQSIKPSSNRETNVLETFPSLWNIYIYIQYIDSLVHGCSISISNTLGRVQSCTKPLIWYYVAWYNSYDAVITVETTWWLLQMSWCLCGIRTSATTMMIQVISLHQDCPNIMGFFTLLIPHCIVQSCLSYQKFHRHKRHLRLDTFRQQAIIETNGHLSWHISMAYHKTAVTPVH